jgi:hypothetical protein
MVMSSFIRTSVGFLNLQHILLIRVGIEKEEGEDLVQMSDGRNIQCLIYDRDFLPQPKPEATPPATEDENLRRTSGPVPATEDENLRRTMPPAAERRLVPRDDPKETPSPVSGEGV